MEVKNSSKSFLGEKEGPGKFLRVLKNGAGFPSAYGTGLGIERLFKINVKKKNRTLGDIFKPAIFLLKEIIYVTTIWHSVNVISPLFIYPS